MSEIEKYYNGEIHVDFDEEIEELKADIEEYRDSTTWWSNRFNAVERDNRELRKEIERLNNLLKETSQILSEETIKSITLKSENERLNNIINELEKRLIFDSEESNQDYVEEYLEGCVDEASIILDYLQELKGSDKVE